tara:strand:- start:3914 stop:4111 length:198 start_codon:yes stop_codon:yes gene_type:complete
MEDVDAVLIAEGIEEVDSKTYVEAWQHLIDTGLAWSLQGWFGRTANELIENGNCTDPGKRSENEA